MADHDDVLARIPDLTPAESAESSAETIQKMLDMLEPWSSGRWAFAIFKLEQVLNRFRTLPKNPTASHVEDLDAEFIGLLCEAPPFRYLHLAAIAIPVVQTATERLEALKVKLRKGTITDEERAVLTELRPSLESFQSDVRRYLQEFRDAMGGCDADNVE